MVKTEKRYSATASPAYYPGMTAHPAHAPVPNPPPACYLNDLGLRDGLALYRIAADPGFFYAYLNENRQPAWLGTLRFLALTVKARLRRPRHWFKAIRRWPDGALLGCVVLLDIGVLAPRVGEIAYFLSPTARGQGIATQAVISAARWAQQTLDLRGLYASVDPDNPASLAILTRLGLSPIRFVSAAQSSFTDRHGRPRPCWTMQTTPASFAAALAALPESQYPVLNGHKRPDAMSAVFD